MRHRGGRTQYSLYQRSETRERRSFSPDNSRASRGDQQVWKGLASGLAAGLAATWVMTQYQVNSQKLISKIQARRRRQEQPEPSQQQSGGENPTIKVADTMAQKIAGHDLPQEKRPLAGNLVHYGFGTLMGGLYGVLREVWLPSGVARGVAYGAVLWAGADEIVLPAVGLAKWAPEYPMYVHADALGAHLTYAVTLDSVRAGVRRLFEIGAGEPEEQGRSLRGREGEEGKHEFRAPQVRARPHPPAVLGRKESFGERRREHREKAA